MYTTYPLNENIYFRLFQTRKGSNRKHIWAHVSTRWFIYPSITKANSTPEIQIDSEVASIHTHSFQSENNAHAPMERLKQLQVLFSADSIKHLFVTLYSCARPAWCCRILSFSQQNANYFLSGAMFSGSLKKAIDYIHAMRFTCPEVMTMSPLASSLLSAIMLPLEKHWVSLLRVSCKSCEGHVRELSRLISLARSTTERQ